MEMSLDELLDLQVDEVYGASKNEQAISEMPSSVTIITADGIKEQGHRTLAEVPGSVRVGVEVTDTGATFILELPLSNAASIGWGNNELAA